MPCGLNRVKLDNLSNTKNRAADDVDKTTKEPDNSWTITLKEI